MNNSFGQISIFLAMGLMSIIALLAFVINVGSFVKAKINLQNAVDASAWAGAAVQSRQLSRIAHLNWALRNNYKEWMFKYYVLGQLGLTAIKEPITNNMNFRLEPFEKSSGVLLYNSDAYDKYNVPTICIHQGSGHNICKTSTIPGLPRFSSIGLINVSQNHESILTSFVTSKAKDCSRRTNVNFLAAKSWAYGSGIPGPPGQYPHIAGNRTGAWIRAIEIALRIRNQEFAVNLPPSSSPICSRGGNCTAIDTIESNPIHERQHKAFMSGYRNLGGGRLKDNGDDELSSQFKLTELAPTSKTFTTTSLSGFLIPQGPSLTKYYLDLIATPINYTTFFTFFKTFTQEAQGVPSSESACAGTKVALPVPGFIMGFYKNPKFLTYYSVKGETKYRGLLNPFTNKDISLSAYATAKPMGGRIGPRLFKASGESLFPRIKQTASFASVLKPPLPTERNLGLPIPNNKNFWADQGSSIGGTPSGSATVIKYVIPNMVYDFKTSADEMSRLVGAGTSGLITLNKATSLTNSLTPPTSELAKGLYDKTQFELLRKQLVTSSSTGYTLSAKEVAQAIQRVRAPTKYDRLNYMIPSVVGNPKNDDPSIENMPDATSRKVNDQTHYSFYAPIYGPNTLFPNGKENIDKIIKNYMTALKPSVDTFIKALEETSNSIRSTPTKGSSSYAEAANSIWNTGFKNIAAKCGGTTNQSQISLAGSFYQFFSTATDTVCGIETLSKKITDYINQSSGQDFKNTYSDLYFENTGTDPFDIYSAYTPGRRQGAQNNGTLTNPYLSGSLVAKRNFYSTKLIKTEKIITSGEASYGSKEAIIMEHNLIDATAGFDQKVINTIDRSQLEGFGNLYY